MFTEAELLVLVDGIYAGILDRTAWEAALARLCRAVGGEAAALSLHDARNYGVVSVDFINVDPTYQSSYGELIKLPDMAGAFRIVTEAGACGALTGEDIMAAAPDYGRSRFRDEWLRPQQVLDMIATPFLPAPSVAGGLYIGRPQRGTRFGTRQLDALQSVRPHLARAVDARLRLDGTASVASAALAALDVLSDSVLLVNSTSSVVHANRAAEAALRQSDGVVATRSVLVCDHTDDTAKLRRLVGEASSREPDHSGGLVAVRRRSGRRPLSALVAPLRGAGPVSFSRRATAMVLLADPEAAPARTADALRLAYGLTAAEARTALALLHHTRLADVAGSLGVSLATVRTLLQRAFNKTDTHSQAELVRLMLAHWPPTAPVSAN